MPVTICWSAKGGSGTTVVAAALALAGRAESLLVDLDGELPAVLGLPEPGGQGIADWLASDAAAPAIADLAIAVDRTTSLVPRGSAGVDFASARWPELLSWLDARGHVVIDAGTRPLPGELVLPGIRSLLVTRGCYLALRRARRQRGSPTRCRTRRRARTEPAPAGSRTVRGRAGRRHGDCRSGSRPRRRRRAAQRVPPESVAARTARRQSGMSGMSGTVSTVSTVDDGLVTALCRAAEREPGDTTSVVRSHVRRVAPLAGTAATEELVRAAVARLDGLGELDALLRDPTIDEVLVNSGGEVWIERDGDLQPVGHLAGDDLAVVVERILAPLGRRVDRSSPVVDARLPDGSRVCAVVPPVAVDGACLTVRRFHDRALPLLTFCDDAVARLLEELVARRCNVIVSGATSSGKTSLLNSTLALAPAGERLVIIEDTAELLPRVPHLVRLEARPSTPDGPVAITLEHLVRTALRLRPDRLIVGEVRGPEVVALVQALNTGHDGAWSTCHANSALDALHRLETLILAAAPAWPLTAARQQLARSIDVVVHVARTGHSARRIVEIGEVIGDDPLELRPIVTDGFVVDDLRRGRP